MRTTLALLLLSACSSNNPAMDGGTDASSDVSTDTSSSDSGSNCASASATVTGTIQAATLSAKDAVYAPPANGGSAFAAIADVANVCPIVKANANKANAKVFVLVFTGGAPKVGMTPVGSMVLDAQWAAYDATCSSMGGSADSGSVTITRADSCGVVGTFDLTFGNDHVTGSFTAPTCTIPPSDGGSTTCQQ